MTITHAYDNTDRGLERNKPPPDGMDYPPAWTGSELAPGELELSLAGSPFGSEQQPSDAETSETIHLEPGATGEGALGIPSGQLLTGILAALIVALFLAVWRGVTGAFSVSFSLDFPFGKNPADGGESGDRDPDNAPGPPSGTTPGGA